MLNFHGNSRDAVGTVSHWHSQLLRRLNVKSDMAVKTVLCGKTLSSYTITYTTGLSYKHKHDAVRFSRTSINWPLITNNNRYQRRKNYSRTTSDQPRTSWSVQPYFKLVTFQSFYLCINQNSVQCVLRSPLALVLFPLPLSVLPRCWRSSHYLSLLVWSQLQEAAAQRHSQHPSRSLKQQHKTNVGLGGLVTYNWHKKV